MTQALVTKLRNKQDKTLISVSLSSLKELQSEKKEDAFHKGELPH